MDIKDIRLNNLELLIQSEGGRNAVAEKVGTSAVYLSQIKSKTNKRTCGDSLARRLESAFNKPRGWMDTPHSTEIRELDQISGENAPVRFGMDSVDYLEKSIYEVELSIVECGLDITPRAKAQIIINLYKSAMNGGWALSSSWSDQLNPADLDKATLKAV